MIKKLTLCILLYLVFLIVTLPAQHAIGWASLPDDFRFKAVSGTVWQGQAQQLTYRGIPVNGVKWDINPLPLLWGTLEITINAGNQRDSEQIALSGKINLSSHAYRAKSLVVYIPANLAMAYVQLPFNSTLAGRYKVQLDEADWQQGCKTMRGSGEWVNAAVSGSQGMIPLQHFAATLTCNDQNMQVNINPDNVFNLDARVNLTPEGKYSIDGKFKPEASLPQEVHQAARFFGRPDAQGFYRLSIK